MPSGFMKISPSTVVEKKLLTVRIYINMLYRMTVISKKLKNVYVSPFEKTVFGGGFASLSVYLHVFLYGRHGPDCTKEVYRLWVK
jgi:hypothetical protein